MNVQSYYNNPKIFIYTLLLIVILSILLVLLNITLNNIVRNKNSLDIKKLNKRRQTYELRVNSIRSIVTVNTSQSIILALLFLLFNIKITLLIPMILSTLNGPINKQIIIIIYIIFIMLSVYIKITSNIITFYKSKKTKYII